MRTTPNGRCGRLFVPCRRRDGDRREGSPVLRIGIETGIAVVGPFAAGTSFEYGAMGAVVGVAAALQSAAKPGSILVGPRDARGNSGHL